MLCFTLLNYIYKATKIELNIFGRLIELTKIPLSETQNHLQQKSLFGNILSDLTQNSIQNKSHIGFLTLGHTSQITRTLSLTCC